MKIEFPKGIQGDILFPPADGGLLLRRKLSDGRVLDLWPLTFARVRLTISQNDQVQWYEDGW